MSKCSANIAGDRRVQLIIANHYNTFLSPQESMELGRDLIKLSMLAAREQLEQLEKDKEQLILVAYADLSIDKIEVDDEEKYEENNDEPF